MRLPGLQEAQIIPGSLRREPGIMTGFWPGFAISYLILTSIIFLWYHTAAGIIAKNILLAQNLSPILESIRSNNGDKYLYDAIRIKELVWNGGWILIRPLLIAGIICLLGNYIKQGFKYHKALLLSLYGEVVLGVGGALKNFLIIIKDDPNISMSLAAYPGLSKIDIAPGLHYFLSTLNPFLFLEIFVISIGLSANLECTRMRAFQLAIIAVYAFPALKLLFGYWAYS